MLLTGCHAFLERPLRLPAIWMQNVVQRPAWQKAAVPFKGPHKEKQYLGMVFCFRPFSHIL